MKKAPIINRSGNSKSLKRIYFFLEINKLRFFQRSQCHLCLLAFITLFQSSIGYVQKSVNLKFLIFKELQGPIFLALSFVS